MSPDTNAINGETTMVQLPLIKVVVKNRVEVIFLNSKEVFH